MDPEALPEVLVAVRRNLAAITVRRPFNRYCASHFDDAVQHAALVLLERAPDSPVSYATRAALHFLVDLRRSQRRAQCAAPLPLAEDPTREDDLVLDRRDALEWLRAAVRPADFAAAVGCERGNIARVRRSRAKRRIQAIAEARGGFSLGKVRATA